MYPIERLTAFNKAIVYGFDPEKSPAKLYKAADIEDLLFPEAEQHIDLLNAYLYAQDVILPKIKELGIENLSEELLLQWLLDIHKYIGKSLLASYGVESGQYTPVEVERWQQNANSTEEIFDFINDLDFFQGRDEIFIKVYSDKYNVSQKTCKVFANIVKHYHYETMLELKEKPVFGQRNAERVIMVLDKIKRASRQGRLTEEEQKALNQIIIFGMPIEQIPEAMQQFAQQTLKEWRILSTTKNLVEIANSLANIFYHLTSVHPFANCNGRTATCLINIILKSIDLPDIILRYPGERDNVNSDYEKTMSCIMETREPFAKHLLACIIKAQKDPYVDETLHGLVILEVNISTKYQQFQEIPAFNRSQFLRKVEEIKYLINEGQEKLFLKKLYNLIKETEKSLKNQEKSATTIFSNSVNPLLLYKEALNHYKAKSYERAIEILQLAITGFQQKTGNVSAEMATCYSTLASTYRDKNDYDRAITAAEKAFICFDELNKDTKAIHTKYSECLALAKKPAGAIYKLAVNHYKAKHFQTALCQLNYCVTQWQNKVANRNSLASCYSTIASCQRELGLFHDALTSCDAALKCCLEHQRQAIETKREGLIAMKSQSIQRLT